MVQRITYSIPTTTSRGVMFQQSAAYFAIQHLMDLEEVDLPGRVSVKDVYRLVDLLSRQKLKNYRTLSIVTLLRLTLDVNDPSIKKKEMKNLHIKLSEVRHGINDLSDKLDTTPMLVKRFDV
ncbi:hypothetical protein DAPPUDRAFT_331727 [Daphnia pulex]|uniref:Uncharacterized protein n=1 Tax=Daphnia pulex TaxID=6669 RepID=E9HN97_DAPPU|nr:hypothetical protein DAPPUDRAFT_331727 [Daphnia pulex]|eukprot:EFX66719.1 hypothetical protein DAPPUDRAFT_331727 [Daphnia pulex]